MTTLLPICRHYIQYARIGFDTRTLKLPPRTPSEHIREAPYAHAFQHLPKSKLLTATRQVIVFAELMWSAELPDTTNPDSVVLPWYAGVINPTTKRPDPGHRLIIDWSHWSPRARTLAANDIQRKFEAAHDHGHDTRAEREWLFAYAHPDLVNGTDLVVTNDTDYCILTAKRSRAWLPRATPSKHPRSTPRTTAQRTHQRRPGHR